MTDKRVSSHQGAAPEPIPSGNPVSFVLSGPLSVSTSPPYAPPAGSAITAILCHLGTPGGDTETPIQIHVDCFSAGTLYVLQNILIGGGTPQVYYQYNSTVPSPWMFGRDGLNWDQVIVKVLSVDSGTVASDLNVQIWFGGAPAVNTATVAGTGD